MVTILHINLIYEYRIYPSGLLFIRRGQVSYYGTTVWIPDPSMHLLGSSLVAVAGGRLARQLKYNTVYEWMNESINQSSNEDLSCTSVQATVPLIVYCAVFDAPTRIFFYLFSSYHTFWYLVNLDHNKLTYYIQYNMCWILLYWN